MSTHSGLAEHERLTAAIDALEDRRGPRLGGQETVVAALTSVRDTWRTRTSRHERNLSAGFRGITVADGAIVKIELTEAATRHGFLEALPQTGVMAPAA